MHILGMGAQAPIGLKPAAISAAVRANISRFEEYYWLRRKADGSPIVMSLLSTLDLRWASIERMHRMGTKAAGQALAPLLNLPTWPENTPLPILLSVPPFRPGMIRDDPVKLGRKLMSALPVVADEALCGVYDSGHEGGLAALSYAATLFKEGRASVCLVGGVDSYRDIEVLHWLEEWRRLKGDDAPNGLVPGEGAAFLLVCTETFRRNMQLQSFGSVTAPLRSQEPNPWYSRQPCTGDGLTQVIREVLDTALPEGGRADTVWCDLNGESWRADEWSFAYLRTSDRHGEPLNIQHPADALGDLGAATASTLLMLAALDVIHPRSNTRRALVYASSDTRPYRSACVIAHPEEELL
jgi:hypothetical protein